MTTDTTPVPQHDFLAAALVPTNEQRIVAALEQIVVLLTPKPDTPELSLSQFVSKADLAEARKPVGVIKVTRK